MQIEYEPTKRFKVLFGCKVHGEFDTVDEVKAFVAKRIDRKYDINDRGRLVPLKDLKD